MKFLVTLGNGTTAKGQGLCVGIKLNVQEADITKEFVPLRLNNVDMTHIHWRLCLLKYKLGKFSPSRMTLHCQHSKPSPKVDSCAMGIKDLCMLELYNMIGMAIAMCREQEEHARSML